MILVTAKIKRATLNNFLSTPDIKQAILQMI